MHPHNIKSFISSEKSLSSSALCCVRQIESLEELAIRANQIKATDSKAKLLVDEHQAHILTHLEVSTLRKRRWQGLPPRFLKIGSKIRYDYFDLQEFLESCIRHSTSDNGEAKHV